MRGSSRPSIPFLVVMILAAAAMPAVWLGQPRAAVAAACQPGARSHWITGPVRTCGTELMDASGREVRLLSLSIADLGVGDGPAYTPEDDCPSWLPLPSFTDDDIKAWGFNSVRLNLSWANLEPTPPVVGEDGSLIHAWNEDYLEALDQAVADLTAQGVAVVLQMVQVRWSPAFDLIPLPNGTVLCEGWGMPTWLYPDGGGIPEMVESEKDFFMKRVGESGFIAAWKLLAARYSDNSMVVAADVLNEPYDLLLTDYPGVGQLRPKDLGLAGFYERVGNAIHSVNPNLLIIVEDRKNPRTGLWSLTREPQVSRGVFSIHFYSSKWIPNGRNLVSESKERAASWRWPEWIGEFTTFNKSVALKAYPKWASKTRKFLAYTKERSIGWAIWLYGPGQFQRPTDIRTPKVGLLPVIKSGF